MGAPASLPFEGASPSAGLEPEADELRALFAECHNCEAVECFPSNVGLPAGWRELVDERAANGKAVLCPDCAGIPEQADGSPPPTPALAHIGYRLTHQLHLAAGFVTLRLHGGARPRPGADLPATWLTDRAGIRQLITDLEAIDASFSQGE